MTASQAITEARARIIWGESPPSVRNFLISNGISGVVADTKLDEFLREKNADIRQDSIREILSGVVLLGASGGVLFWVVWRGLLISWYAYFPTSAAILICIGLYGVWKLIKGFISLVQSTNGRKPTATTDEPRPDEFRDIGVNGRQTANGENENYSIIGIIPPCSLDQLKAAYRQRMKEYHPDRYPTEAPEFRKWAEERAKAINAAYETLLAELDAGKQ